MIDGNLVFSGFVRVYLQGQNALMPINLEKGELSLAIGDEKTQLFIYDKRDKTIDFLTRIERGESTDSFAKVFNQSAKARIWYKENIERLDIELMEDDISDASQPPLLWMGILDDEIMPAHIVEWEILKSLSRNKVAFAALIL